MPRPGVCSGVTPDGLYEAIEKGDAAKLRALLPSYRREEDPGDGVMSHASESNAAMLPLLLQLGIDPDERDTFGNTALMSAAAQGSMDVIRLLLDAGADIDARNYDWETPFSFACAWDQLEAAQFLHARGANVRCEHREGGTPFDDGCASPRIRAWLAEMARAM